MTIVVQSGTLRTSGGADTTTGLKSYWLFNEGNGGTALDSVGHHDAAAVGTPGWSGDFFIFDGFTVCTAADHADFAVTTDFTIFLWVNGSAQSGKACFAQYDLGTTNRSWAMQTSDAGSFNTIRAVVTDAGAGGNFKIYTGSQVCFDSTWHSICMRWSGGTLDLFVDGVKDSSPDKSSADNSLTANSVFGSTASISFGDLLNGGSAAGVGYAGDMKKVRFYNIAKSDSDISGIHALGA